MPERRIRRGCFVLLYLHLLTHSLWAQTAAAVRTPPARLKVFIDCEYECDTEYLRQTIEFIDYVRDRAAADVHVLVTTQGTGGGGMAWNLKFIGQEFFQDRDHTLTFTTPTTATDDDRRKELARVFKVGLVSYAAETTIAPNLDVSFKRIGEQLPPSKLEKDRWNFWVFRVGVGGNMSGEQTSNNRSYRMNFSASRTTELWKINVSMYGNTNQSTFKVSDDLTVKSSTNGWNFNTLVVRSIGPKWSYGAKSSVSHSSFSNTGRSIGGSPAIEFDFFPYSESTRRSLTVQYSIGATKYQYRELTIFDKLEETVPSHSLQSSIGLRAPWGSLGGTATISQHLNHTDRYRISFYGNTDIRLFKGFSFNIYSQYDKIADQIGLRKEEATTEEVLLRLKQRATGYSYYLNFGINYSFGSIFNSTVNPRFGF
jgi:hypothetical protein